MDTIACGATIAFAMECFENEVLNRDDTGGLELSFGNAEAMLAVLNQIVRKRRLRRGAGRRIGAGRPDDGAGSQTTI